MIPSALLILSLFPLDAATPLPAAMIPSDTIVEVTTDHRIRVRVLPSGERNGPIERCANPRVAGDWTLVVRHERRPLPNRLPACAAGHGVDARSSGGSWIYLSEQITTGGSALLSLPGRTWPAVDLSAAGLLITLARTDGKDWEIMHTNISGGPLRVATGESCAGAVYDHFIVDGKERPIDPKPIVCTRNVPLFRTLLAGQAFGTAGVPPPSLHPLSARYRIEGSAVGALEQVNVRSFTGTVESPEIP